MAGSKDGAARALDAVSRIVREARMEQDADGARRAVARLTAECMGYRAAALGIIDSDGLLKFTVFGEAPNCQEARACREAPTRAPDGSWISAPLAGIGRFIGTLIGYGHGTGTFDAEDQEKRAGVFSCAGCDLPVFGSDKKFDSGTGWPSFWGPIDEKALGTKTQGSGRFLQTEVHCRRCGGHLGHIFPDGPEPTGLRYCINGVALKFKSADA